MASTDPHFSSLDETIAEIKKVHEEEMKALKDQLLAREIECTLLEKQLAEADEAEKQASAVSVRLMAQFSTVEAVFAEAKHLALQVEAAGLVPRSKIIVDDSISRFAPKPRPSEVVERLRTLGNETKE